MLNYAKAVGGIVETVHDLARKIGDDAVEFAVACGAPPELVDELRAADTVRRLKPLPEAGIGLSFNSIDIARVATINEVRAGLGLPPLPEGDVPLP